MDGVDDRASQGEAAASSRSRGVGSAGARREASVADGFSGATDLAVDRHGRIFVAELAANRISVIKHGRVRPYVEVPSPGAVEVGKHGTLYATTDVFGADEQAPPNGKVVKITPRHRRR